jgi:hypothetical protein
MTEALNFNENNTPLLIAPDEEIGNDALYANNVASLLGDESVNDIRRRQFAEAEEDILQATVKNISRPDMDAQTRSFAEAYAYENYALSLFEKYRKDSDVMNKEVADRVNGKLFEEKPQTFLNALTDTPENFEDVGMFDNRIYDLNYSLSQRIEDPTFDSILYGRIARDVGLNIAGGLLLKGKGGAVKKIAGKFLSSYGLGHYIDWGVLGEKTIYEAQQIAYQLKLDAIGASDEEYEQKKEAFIQFIEDIPEAYRGDVLQGVEEGPSIYADAGGAATAYGLQAYARSFKAYGYLLGKAKNLKAWEKIAKGFGRKSTPAAVEDVEDVAEAIDARKSTALVPYVDHPLTVMSEGVNNRTLSLAPPKNPTILLPDGRRVTYLLPPEERLRLPKPVEYEKIGPSTTKLLESDIERMGRWAGINDEGLNYKGSREWLPEKRRIRYTYDNEGRGYTEPEADRILINIERAIQDTMETAKKTKVIVDENGHLTMPGREKRLTWRTVAASPTPFTRAAANERTRGIAEGSASYGPGPYGSIAHNYYVGTAAEATYSKALNRKQFNTIQRQALDKAKSKYPDADFESIEKLIDSVLSVENMKHTSHFDPISELKSHMKGVKENKNNDRALVKVHNEVVKDMLKAYKNKKTSVLNYWWSRDFDPKHGIDQRYTRTLSKGIYDDQHPAIQKALLQIDKDIMETLQELGVVKKENGNWTSPTVSELDGETITKQLIFQITHPEEFSITQWLPNATSASTLSYYIPYYKQIAIFKMDIKDFEKFGLTEDNIYQPLSDSYLKTVLPAFRKHIYDKASDMLAKDLTDHGIWNAVQSSTNIVVFKDTDGMYSNVFKQEYNMNGMHYQRVLDNGAIKRYDPNLKRFVIDYYMTTPGRGRKPVIIHKQPITNNYWD